MLRPVAISLTVLAAVSSFAAARATPTKEPPPLRVEDVRHGCFGGGHLQLRAERSGDRVDVELTNTYNAPVTADLSFETTNMTPLRPTHTVTVPPRGSARVASFKLERPREAFTYSYVMDWLFGDPGARPGETIYDLPYAAGERYRVMQGHYGAFSHRDVAAIDWGMPEGTPVLAAREGVVVAFNDTAVGHGLDPEFRALEKANWVIVRHPDGTLGCYFHLLEGGVRVAAGQQVVRGQLLGLSGNTGFSNAPHLHFEVRSPIDGQHFRTFPVRFHTEGGDPAGEPLLEGSAYSAPGDT
jgi:murein DD-endopeptidase MepM/ murein hydrolase activator NlpD